MARGVPLSREFRAEVAEGMQELLGTPEGSIRKLAERYGISPTAIRRIRDEFGLISPEEARAKTKNGARALAASNAERRAMIAKRLLDEAERALDDMSEPALMRSFGGKDNTYAEHLMDEPDFAGRRTLMTIVGIALDKALVIEKFDAESGAASDFELFQRWIAGGGEV